MKKLSLNASAFQKGEVLTRSQLKKVLGGDGSGLTDLCADKTGDDLKLCRYNVCMSGWVATDHDDQANKNKIDSCCAASGYC